MKDTLKTLEGTEVLARDGSVGQVVDAYFDDEQWALRYLVVETGGWLNGRRVLLSPASVEGITDAGEIRVDLTREQVMSAPDAEDEPPASRQYEMRHAAHFGYPYYWSGPALWGYDAYPRSGVAPSGGMSPSREEAKRGVQERLAEGDPHLRSGREVLTYGIEASDGAAGEVEDLVFDPRSWAIREILVDARTWWPGGHVRLTPRAVERIDAAGQAMRVRFTREALRSPGHRG